MNKKHLSGAFSPFTIALQNIRDNLLSKKDSEDIGDFYLQEIIALSIQIHIEAKGNTNVALEFPVAACWRYNLEDNVILRYAGQYTSGDVEIFEENRQAQQITYKILDKIREYQGQELQKTEVFYKPPECPFADSEIRATGYPESLRKLMGYWRFNCNDLRFLVFFTYVPDPPKDSIGEDDLKRIRESFKKYFLAEDAYRYLSRLKVIRPNKEHKYEDKDKKGYPVLRDILSNIQKTIDTIPKPDESKGEDSTGVETSPSEDKLEKIFNVVFVVPTIMDQDDKVGFRYLLTHRQVRFFEEKETGNSLAEKIDSYIKKKENDVFRDFGKSLKNVAPDAQVTTDVFCENSSKQLKAFVNNLEDNLIRDEYGNIDKNRNGEVEELLRKAIYAYYAFAPKTKTELSYELSGGNIVKYIESDRGTVTYEQAFLIRHIFNARSPDVVENFINHPLAKLWKPTGHLIEHMDDDSLYPRALHLLEMIFFPNRFFMYPLYHHGAPILLCAFNADSYVESRQSLKSILDRNTQGIFSAILNYELLKANESFASMTSWSDTEAIGQFKRILRPLLLRFCLEIEKIENIELGVKNAPDLPSVVVNYNGRERREFSVGIPKLATIKIPLQSDTEQLLSYDGQQVLHHYLELYAETFDRFRKIAELSSAMGKSKEAESQTLRWAHAIKTELGEISTISEKIAPTGEMPIYNETNISSYTESLKIQVNILTNSVKSLENRVKALQLSASTDISDYIQAEASREDFRCVMFDALQIAFLNLLLSTKRECSDKRSRWFDPKFIRGNSSYNNEEFGMALRNILLLKYKGDDSVSKLISQMNIIFNRNNHNQAEYPLKIADSSFFKFSIPSSKEDKYYPNILVIILSEVIFNALKYTDEDVEIGIEENNSYNFISVKNPFSCVKSGTDIGLSLVKTMSERVLKKSELSEFTYGNNDKRVWIFKIPVYKCESKQTNQWGSYV